MDGRELTHRMHLQRLSTRSVQPDKTATVSVLSSTVTEWKGMRRQDQTFLKGTLGRDKTSATWKFHLDIGKTCFLFGWGFLPQAWSTTEKGV